MFLYYQHLTIVWILLQFLNYSEQTTYGKFFSSLPVELSEQAFPVTYKSNHSSDVVIVKCPGLKYKHIGIKDHFVLDEDLRKTGLLYLTDNEVFAWTPAVYNSSGPSSVHCGIFYQDNANSPGIIKYNWTFNMNWEMKPNPQKIEELQTITTKPTFMGNKCGTDQTLTMVYHKDRKKGMKKFEMDNKVTAHVNDLYYYFNKPDNNDKMEVKGPCAIVRAVNEPPQIIIENHNSSSIPYNKTKIYTIKQEYTSGSYSIKLHLEDEINLPDFYEGEKIKMKKMRYTRKGIKEIPNSDEIVTSTFSIQGFQLVKFSYDCPTTTGINVISKMFYFEPASKNYKFPNENTIYFPNETTIQPNCSIERVTFGYLDSVTVNSLTTNLNDLGKNGLSKNNLKRVGDFIFVLEVKGNNVTLNCNYVTLNGMVTLIQTFIQGKKVFVGYNDKGEEMYETRMINDKREELEKKLAEKDKELIAQKYPFLKNLKIKLEV
uniref:6-cysteine protein n=2 Tax=Strongyloides stercoralis TaxID=6248 RepID=A0A0K0E260_STRER